jgi:hypothetical protein
MAFNKYKPKLKEENSQRFRERTANESSKQYCRGREPWRTERNKRTGQNEAAATLIRSLRCIYIYI